MLKSLLFLFVLLIPASTLSDSIDVIKHDQIKSVTNNKTFIGVSSFALGVKSFPREDTTKKLGYNSFIRTVKKVATNELYTFPEKQNRDNIKNTIAELIAHNHKVFHEIHILNGPAMRRGLDNFANSIYNKKMYNKEFKSLLKNDSYTRSRVGRLFKKAVIHAKTLKELGATVVICPELEDNQDNESFEILVKLLRKAGWKDTSKIVRNSVYNYSPTRAKMIYEMHLHSLNEVRLYAPRLRKNSIINNDGYSFRFKTESNTSKTMSQDDIEDIIKITQKNKIIFYAWYSPLQGYSNTDQSFNGEYTKRNYTISKKNRKVFGAMLAQKSVKEVFKN